MKIIKQGERPEDRTWETTCSNCGTVICYKQDDMKFQASVEHEGFNWYPPSRSYSYIICPICTKKIVV